MNAPIAKGKLKLIHNQGESSENAFSSLKCSSDKNKNENNKISIFVFEKMFELKQPECVLQCGNLS